MFLCIKTVPMVYSSDHYKKEKENILYDCRANESPESKLKADTRVSTIIVTLNKSCENSAF